MRPVVLPVHLDRSHRPGGRASTPPPAGGAPPRSESDVAEAAAHFPAFAVAQTAGRGRRALRAGVWLGAFAISFLANAEFLILVAHRSPPRVEAVPADPAAVLIDLPASQEASPSDMPVAAALYPVAPSRSDPEQADADQVVDTRAQPTTREAVAGEAPAGDAGTKEVAVAPADAVNVAAPPDSTGSDAARPARTPPPGDAVPLPVTRPRGRPRAVAAHATRSATRPVRTAQAGGGSGAPRMAAAPVHAEANAAPAEWKSRVVAALNRAKRYPAGVEASGSPTLRMVVAASGDVGRAAIVTTSGSAALDAAAIATVRRASPLPPPPSGPVGLTFRMNFRLETP